MFQNGYTEAFYSFLRVVFFLFFCFFKPSRRSSRSHTVLFFPARFCVSTLRLARGMEPFYEWPSERTLLHGDCLFFLFLSMLFELRFLRGRRSDTSQASHVAKCCHTSLWTVFLLKYRPALVQCTKQPRCLHIHTLPFSVLLMVIFLFLPA